MSPGRRNSPDSDSFNSSDSSDSSDSAVFEIRREIRSENPVMSATWRIGSGSRSKNRRRKSGFFRFFRSPGGRVHGASPSVSWAEYAAGRAGGGLVDPDPTLRSRQGVGRVEKSFGGGVLDSAELRSLRLPLPGRSLLDLVHRTKSRLRRRRSPQPSCARERTIHLPRASHGGRKAAAPCAGALTRRWRATDIGLNPLPETKWASRLSK